MRNQIYHRSKHYRPVEDDINDIADIPQRDNEMDLINLQIISKKDIKHYEEVEHTKITEQWIIQLQNS